MSVNSHSIATAISEIDRYSDPSSPSYGRLLHWQDLPNPVWHYGIGLSDRYIFDPIGLQAFTKKQARPVLGIDSIALSPEITIQRLKYALTVFKDWRYNLLGWNCEHLSRLIATDQPRCYQSKPVWWMCNLTPEGDHKIARQVLTGYLKQIS